MDILKLKTRLRTGTGKSYTRKVRNQGWIPAVYYGHDRNSKSIEVDYREFSALVRHRKLNHLIDLTIPGEEADSVTIIKEVQKHVLKDALFFHIDFQHVAMDEKITVQCPIILKGISIGVKDDGGILNQQIRSLKVSCLPKDIPDFIEIEISELKIGEALHVRDVKAPGVDLKDSPEDVILVIVHPQTEAVAATAAPTEGAEGAEGADAAEGAEGAKAKEGDSKAEKSDKEKK